MNGVREWIVRIVAAALCTGAVRSLVPEGTGKAFVSLVAGLAVLAVILKPVAALRTEDFSAAVAESILADAAATADFEAEGRSAMAAIIKQKSEAYILDKGKSLGIGFDTVTVTVSEDGTAPIPYAAEVTGKYTRDQREDLTRWIEANLAIPEERQSWTWH